jgi:hypothetical protein
MVSIVMPESLDRPPGGTSTPIRHDERMELIDGAAEVLTRLLDERRSELLALVLAVVAVSWTTSWRWTRTVVTIAHEGGHALTAVLAGRGLTGIRLHADTSGLTVSTGARRGPGLVATFLGGYPAPPLLAVGGAALVAADLAALMLWIALGLLAATLIHVRNLFGVVSVLATGALVAAVSWWGTPRLQDGFAAALVWFLLFGGLQAVRELWRGRRRSRGVSDADMLASLTRVPSGIWAGIFGLVSVAAVIAAGGLMLS